MSYPFIDHPHKMNPSLIVSKFPIQCQSSKCSKSFQPSVYRPQPVSMVLSWCPSSWVSVSIILDCSVHPRSVSLFLIQFPFYLLSDPHPYPVSVVPFQYPSSSSHVLHRHRVFIIPIIPIQCCSSPSIFAPPQSSFHHPHTVSIPVKLMYVYHNCSKYGVFAMIS